MESEGANQNGASPRPDSHSGELPVPDSKFSETEKTADAFDYQSKILEDRISGLLKEIRILKEEKQSVLSQKEELENRMAVLNVEIQSVNEEKDELFSLNEEVRSQLTEEIDRLGRLLSEKKDIETELQNEKTQLQKRNEAIESQVCELLSEKDVFLSKLKGVEVLEKENEELREEISVSNKFKDDTLGNLINEKDTLVTELMDVKLELESLKNANISLKDRLVEALKQVSKLREENASLQKNMESIGGESQRQLITLEEEHSRLQEEMEKQRMEIDMLHTMKTGIEQEKISLGKKFEEVSRELEVVGGDQQQIDGLENQLKNISSEKKDLQIVNLNLENEVKRLALGLEEQEKHKARIREFEVNFEAVKIALESKDNTIQQLTLELKSLQHSPVEKQNKSLLWPAVLASGSLGVAAAFGYIKFSKHP